MNTRPPIVVVMGHVNHGKTTLLDYIRKTAVAEREAGGITQSIGAYEIVHQPRTDADLTRTNAEKSQCESASGQRGSAPAEGRKITFIDTPGHEAFSNMRAYGAKVADIAILVVAADDGVKPQTKDALAHIRAEKIPFVVAINKIDKSNADIEKTKNDLAQSEVFLEGRGGNVSWQAISAKQGTGVSELLDLILLAAEVQSIQEETVHGCASGIVTSARLDPRRGIVVGGIICGGTLAQGYTIGTASASGKVRMLENFLGKSEKELKPSAPCAIIGFESLPKIGEQFFASNDAAAVQKAVAESKAKIKTTQSKQKTRVAVEGEEIIPLVLKADESASLEALEGLIGKLSAALPLVIVSASVGDIHETDLKNTEHAAAVIVGFRVKIDKAAHNVSDARKIPIISSNIIYELEKELVAYASKAVSKVLPSMLILAVFGARKGRQQIVGGRVLVGPVKNQSAFEMWHEKRKICSGKVLNLQSERKDVAEANAGQEIGLSVESDEPIKVGNTLIFG